MRMRSLVGRYMKNVGQVDKDKSNQFSTLKISLRLMMIVQLLSLSCWSEAYAQTAVTKYQPINGSVMPFTIYIAPATLPVASVSGAMKYNALVTTANVNWTHVPDADQYKLEWLNASTQQWNNVYDGSAMLYIAENLPLGLQYFRVTACGGDLCGAQSSSASVLIEENLDLDLDGVLDQNDACLGTVEGATTSAAGCVPSTADTDGDGITNDLDFCNGEDATSTFANSNGCTPDQIDSDGDGVADYQDSYPFQSDTQCTP